MCKTRFPALLVCLIMCLGFLASGSAARAQTVIRSLASTDIFQGLGDVEIHAVASLGKLIELPAGAVLFKFGVSSPNLYCLTRGRANVIVESGETVTIVGPRTTLGEIEFVDGGPASASVVMDQPGQAVVIKKEALRQLLAGNPAMGYKVMSAIAKKISLQLRASN